MEQANTCPKCKAANLESGAVCWQCGHKLKDVLPDQFGTPVGASYFDNYTNFSDRPEPQAKRPTALSVVLVLSWVVAGLALLITLGALAMFPSIMSEGAKTRHIDAAMIQHVKTVIYAGISVVIAIIIASILVASQVWRGKAWARIVYIIFSIIGILFQIYLIVPSPSLRKGSHMAADIVFLIGALWYAMFLVILLLPSSKAYCTNRKRPEVGSHPL